MFDLKGKRALVTGASGGIGAAIAEVLFEQGASVALHGTRRDALDALAEGLGAGVAVTPADLSDAEAVEALAKDVTAELGGIDILVNNAGITRDQLAMRMKDADWSDVLRVNLESAFRLSRACLRDMMRSRWGRIVNITSIVGVTGNVGQANYAASKAGLIGMSKSFAQEVASRGITVNCVAPGFIETPMTDELDEKQRDNLVKSIPAGRLGQPADVAAAVLYLASEEAGYVTGHTLHVNGGMAMI